VLVAAGLAARQDAPAEDLACALSGKQPRATGPLEYRGQWRDNVLHGIGRIVDTSTGRTWKGLFARGRLHTAPADDDGSDDCQDSRTDPAAAGESEFEDPRVPLSARGSFSRGLLHGAAKLTLPGGTTITGTFAAGAPHGPVAVTERGVTVRGEARRGHVLRRPRVLVWGGASAATALASSSGGSDANGFTDAVSFVIPSEVAAAAAGGGKKGGSRGAGAGAKKGGGGTSGGGKRAGAAAAAAGDAEQQLPDPRAEAEALEQEALEAVPEVNLDGDVRYSALGRDTIEQPREVRAGECLARVQVSLAPLWYDDGVEELIPVAGDDNDDGAIIAARTRERIRAARLDAWKRWRVAKDAEDCAEEPRERLYQTVVFAERASDGDDQSDCIGNQRDKPKDAISRKVAAPVAAEAGRRLRATLVVAPDPEDAAGAATKGAGKTGKGGGGGGSAGKRGAKSVGDAAAEAAAAAAATGGAIPPPLGGAALSSLKHVPFGPAGVFPPVFNLTATTDDSGTADFGDVLIADDTPEGRYVLVVEDITEHTALFAPLERAELVLEIAESEVAAQARAEAAASGGRAAKGGGKPRGKK
jgi:hypothetical protein